MFRFALIYQRKYGYFATWKIFFQFFFFFLNVWWHDATLFVYFSFTTYIHTFIQ
jgi:hypothetical protein